MPREKYIRASDIGTHAFCARALHLKDAGAPSTLAREQEAGTAYHAAHGQRVQVSRRNRQISTTLILIAFALLLLGYLVSR